MSMMAISLGVFQEHTIRPNMHSALFYALVSMTIPLWLATIAGASANRWACTWVGALYTADYLAFIWILPRFAAEPKLGPVYQTVTQFVPPDFPLLLFDRARVRPRPWRGGDSQNWPKWRQAAGGRGRFSSGAFLAAQWPFA